MHESTQHDRNCFITLTYDEKHLPKFQTLIVKDFQDFMKRLRFHINGDRRKKFIGPHLPYRKIKYYHCGEYGDRKGRPHYHAALFGWDFPDMYPIGRGEKGHTYYASAELQKLWPKGHSMIGELTFETAAYIARYITKKVNGHAADQHYEVIDIETGECIDRKKEYATGSQGLGAGWLKKFKKEVVDNDFCYLDRGNKIVKVKVPRYYDKVMELENPEWFLARKMAREASIDKNHPDLTWERLLVREEVQTLKLSRLVKTLERDI